MDAQYIQSECFSYRLPINVEQRTGVLEMENRQAKKKILEKALIPLPPTGFASVFCAKSSCGAIEAALKPAAGAVMYIAISRSARICKEV